MHSDISFENIAESIVDSLCGVADATMRLHSLIGKIKDMAPEAVAELLQYIVKHAGQEKGKYALVLECIDIAAITKSEGNAFMSDLYTYARQHDCDDLVNMLLRPEASKVSKDKKAPQDDIPSGVRVAMSKTLDRMQLAKLMNDSNPFVISTLLNNPVLTEKDVLKICSRRPVGADILQEVYRSRRWIARYSVKKSLLLNPYCPPQIGSKLIHFMMEQDLRLIAETADLHSSVKDIAQEKIKNPQGSGDT